MRLKSMKMSKLERLNARVEKLLVKAVQEVLEVVKETVSEYQEKTARTQRENQSLKRRLQELQEKINSQRNEIPLICDTQQNNMKQDLKLTPSEEDTGPTNSFEDTPTESLLIPCLSLNSKIKHLGSDDEHNTRPRNTGASNGSAAISNHMDQIFTPDSIKAEPTSDEDSMNNKNYLHCDAATGSTSLRKQEAAQISSGLYKELSVVFSMNQSGARESLSKIYSNTNSRAAEEQHTDPKACASGSRGVQRKVRKHYSCSLCGRIYRHAGDFKKHNRVHTGEKPYCCLVCGKRFGQSGYLTVHLRCHTGEKPFGCSHCGKSFSHSSNMKKHVTRCHRRDWG
ncbi:zinc finger protein 90-like isoform X2 [Betta splendens]|uniref:Zinc finger protein 90-like isoform X2 n=1 Tax=Betta splendens TaxID=158456 RepID=A0A9W2XF99_BETSP|nr:zinc finger protein 90-like isoform X2 [Betta splendens]